MRCVCVFSAKVSQGEILLLKETFVCLEYKVSEEGTFYCEQLPCVKRKTFPSGETITVKRNRKLTAESFPERIFYCKLYSCAYSKKLPRVKLFSASSIVVRTAKSLPRRLFTVSRDPVLTAKSFQRNFFHGRFCSYSKMFARRYRFSLRNLRELTYIIKFAQGPAFFDFCDRSFFTTFLWSCLELKNCFFS